MANAASRGLRFDTGRPVKTGVLGVDDEDGRSPVL
jgi:hypothetical protein